MSEFDIKVPGGESRRLLTAGKYCDRDIVVTAEGGLPDGDMSDPEYVYAVTRPKDWLPMPWPGDDEMYFLVHVPADSNGYFAVTVTVVAGTLDFGTVADGEFVVLETETTVPGVRFSKILEPDLYGDLTSDGYKQCMVRLKGAFTKSVTVSVSDGSDTKVQRIKDFVCGVDLNNVRFGNNNYPKLSTHSLYYARFVGNGSIFYPSESFSYCTNLRFVSAQKQRESILFLSTLFTNAKSLSFVSDGFFGTSANYTDATRMFNVTGIYENPKIEIPISNCSYMFNACWKLTAFYGSKCNTASSKSFQNMFYECYSLRKVCDLDITSATAVSSLFYGCFSMEALTFAGATTPGGWTIDISTAQLGHEALIRMIDSLPVATATATIVITNNPGASELTDDEIAVATAKNWTVTI